STPTSSWSVTTNTTTRRASKARFRNAASTVPSSARRGVLPITRVNSSPRERSSTASANSGVRPDFSSDDRLTNLFLVAYDMEDYVNRRHRHYEHPRVRGGAYLRKLPARPNARPRRRRAGRLQISHHPPDGLAARPRGERPSAARCRTRCAGVIRTVDLAI